LWQGRSVVGHIDDWLPACGAGHIEDPGRYLHSAGVDEQIWGMYDHLGLGAYVNGLDPQFEEFQDRLELFKASRKTRSTCWRTGACLELAGARPGARCPSKLDRGVRHGPAWVREDMGVKELADCEASAATPLRALRALCFRQGTARELRDGRRYRSGRWRCWTAVNSFIAGNVPAVGALVAFQYWPCVETGAAGQKRWSRRVLSFGGGGRRLGGVSNAFYAREQAYSRAVVKKLIEGNDMLIERDQ